MSTAARTGGPDALYARVEAAVEGTAYRLRRTERGFDLSADVPQASRHRSQLHTYRVELRTAEQAYVMTDVVRTESRGPGGVRGTTVASGRSRYTTWSTAADGTGRQRFSSADGHRLIRGAAAELGWREVRPTGQKVALVCGAVGGLLALGTLIALGAVFLL
ncbi:hypothetical protein [Streptomyces sp. NPDC002564]|uniref:hypothetical protein n=1 Tax=Streptomyces sp. NPDC002564 TaxID=3364649 RepID=UPI0036C4CC25